MIVDVYECVAVPMRFVSVPSGTVPSAIPAVVALGSPYDNLRLFRTGLNLQPNQPNAGIKPGDIIRDITANGYALHEAKITVGVFDPTSAGQAT